MSSEVSGLRGAGYVVRVACCVYFLELLTSVFRLQSSDFTSQQLTANG
ncbi:MAG: hypothetical protein PHP31_01945 [Lentimicrobiaceae bacterium]|nr:hypothetical protein [Lentimicrobiaceae bacterium]